MGRIPISSEPPKKTTLAEYRSYRIGAGKQKIPKDFLSQEIRLFSGVCGKDQLVCRQFSPFLTRRTVVDMANPCFSDDDGGDDKVKRSYQWVSKNRRKL